MLASIGLPGLSGFVGEFLAMLGGFEEYRWAGISAMFVVILAAWYMMRMFQRVVFERAPGEAPDPHDGAFTHGAPAVSGGSGRDHVDLGHGDSHSSDGDEAGHGGGNWAGF